MSKRFFLLALVAAILGTALAIVFVLALFPYLSYIGGSLVILGTLAGATFLIYWLIRGYLDLQSRYFNNQEKRVSLIHASGSLAYIRKDADVLHYAVEADVPRLAQYSSVSPGYAREMEPARAPLSFGSGGARYSPQILPAPYDFMSELGTFKPSPAAIFLGRAATGPLTIPVSILWHIALTGPTGGGKTAILRLLLSQLLAVGSTIYLCDIHYAPVKKGVDWRPIESRLAYPPFRDAKDIAGVVTWLARSELQARIDREYRGEPIGEPIFLAVEELPAIIDEKPEMAPDLAKILRQGRQYDLCFVGATQDMLVKTIGASSGVRECFRTGYYTGGDVTTAKVVLDLQKGQAIEEDGLGVDGLVYVKTARHPASLARIPWPSNESIYALLGEPGQVASQSDSEPGRELPAFLAQASPTTEPLEQEDILQQALQAWQNGANSIRKLEEFLSLSHHQATKLVGEMKRQGLID
jgi:exonuclease VII small subunit